MYAVTLCVVPSITICTESEVALPLVTYSINDIVYVLIPDGNFENNKVILYGKFTSN